MNVLATMASWPVGAAAGAVIVPAGVCETFGDTHQRFALASVTKPLTALTLLVAVEEEAVGLDDAALESLLPGATLRHLLAHASGLAADRLVAAVAPGTRRIYSNVGIDAAAEHLVVSTGITFETYFAEAVAAPLRLRATHLGARPSRDGVSTVHDLSVLLAQLLQPTALHASTVTAATTVQFPGLRGVLPGFGPQVANDWGLGLEIKAAKEPHWTGRSNSPATFGHFGQSGSMVWVDPVNELALVALADRPFGDWARTAWPALSDAAVLAHGRKR